MFFSFIHLKRESYLLSLGVIFNAYAALYFFSGVILYESLINDWNINYNLSLIKELCILAVISFNGAYLLSFRSRGGKESYIPSYSITYFICIMGVIFQVLLIFKVGPIEFFTMDRVKRFAIFSDSKALLLLSNLLYISFVFAAVRFYITKNAKDKSLFICMALIILTYAILTISRTHITIVAITCVFVFERQGYWKKKNIFLTMLLLAILMLFFKGFLYGIFFQEQNYEKFNPGEFINWIRNTIMVFESEYYGNKIDFSSYILTIKSLVMISPDGQPLSHWFINEFHPDMVSAGLTYGFSGIAEGFMAGGYLGVIFHFSVFGFVFGMISKNESFISIVIGLFIMFIMFRIFRSESYNFVRTLSWYYIYPLIFICASDSVLRRIK
jgi:oligosaccharide repeat unit polymerase